MDKGSSSRSRDREGGRRIEPFLPKTDHNPRELRSWAKRTGFVSTFSTEVTASASERNGSVGFDLERGNEDRNINDPSPRLEIDPILGRNRANRNGIDPGSATGFRDGNARRGGGVDRNVDGNENGRREGENVRNTEGNANGDGVDNRNGNVNEVPAFTKEDGKSERDEEIGFQFGDDEVIQGRWRGPLELKLGLRENPGFAPILYYGLQHYLSLVGSLIFIPIIMVPAMGGTDKDVATVISTMLMISGITTILHTYFGTRLPLVQGSSFVFLAPALVIMNAQEYRNLTDHKFRHIMRELQGAIIVGSISQCILGFSGLISLLLRFINPVVVAPTVAAVGLSFLSYGFPQAGSCIEISVPQIFLVLVFTLYLRGVSIFGHRLFRVYAVSLSVMIVWIYALFLTAGGAYNYKDCSPDIPSSNILTEACRKHAYTMQHCRTDVSNALRTAAWIRIPYPLQWGFPIFHFRTSLIMIIASLVASVDSVGTYHSASSLVSSNPPTPGIVSRGIALEGFCSVLAGLWGTGTGSTTLTENVHTIYATKVANQRAVQIGALLMIFFSFVGKIGAILASIPQALAAAALCFIWALTVALGLLTLRHTETASFRNVTIVGVSLFLGLSVPAYFQQYEPELALILPSYFLPYASASSGPFRTGNMQFDFALNALLSLPMVVTLLIAFILDNTVPGSRQERGVYKWSRAQDIETNPTLLVDYSLPRQISWICCRAKCLGA